MNAVRRAFLFSLCLLLAACVTDSTLRGTTSSPPRENWLPENTKYGFLSVRGVILDKNMESFGSGFVFASDQNGVYAATAAHVTKSLKWVYVENATGDVETAFVIGVDKINDTTLLFIPSDTGVALGLSPLHMGSSDTLKTGEELFILCNPDTGDGFLIRGSFVKKRLLEDGAFRVNVLDIDTGKSDLEGCSGGPVLNANGGVVGMTVKTSASYTRAYAIPVEETLRIIRTIGPVLH